MKEGRHTRPRRALFTTITDHHGGAERVTMALARHLAACPGWDVEVFVVCAKLPVSFTEHTLPSNVRVRFGPWRDWHLSYSFAPVRLIGRRYDLVFSSFIYISGLIALLRRLGLLRIGRLVLRESTPVFDRFPSKPGLFRSFYRQYGAADLLIAQTPYMAKHVLPCLPSRAAANLKVLANPIDGASIRSAATEGLEPELRDRLDGRLNILFCGRLIDVKQPDRALQAFRVTSGNNPDAQLVFVGNGPMEAGLRHYATEAGIADRVVFLGYRPNPYAVMAACQYGLLTSSREGFPNVVLEMMACGLRRIVVTPCADHLDKLRGVLVTESFAVEEIATALRSALSSGEDCRAEYRAVVAERSVACYLDEVLGPALAATRRAGELRQQDTATA